MSSLPYGLMIVLLTWSKIISANDQHASSIDLVPPKSLIEKENILKSPVEQDGSILLNKLTKRSIAPYGLNQPNYENYYNQRPLQPVEISPYAIYPAWQPQVYQMNPPVYQMNPPVYQMNPPVYPMNSPVYQDSRPYYAPAWNSPERYPTRFQSQPAYFNFEYPIDNPPIGNLPLDKDCQSSPCTNPGANIGTRLNDDGPIWDTVPGSTHIRPTRKPGQGPVTFPPLIHNAHDVDVQPETSAVQPSKCVWAIVSCCSAASNKISYSCFEQLECPGAFWDANPCETEFAHAAIANVMKYYQSK